MKFVALLAILFILPLQAKTIRHLTLEDCQQIARKNSYKMRSLLEDYKIAGYELKSAQNRFKTQINFVANLPDYSETISSLVDSAGLHYFPLKQARFSGNLQISQPLPTDGSVYVASGLYHVQDYFRHEQSFRLNTRIGFEQPIEAFYAYNQLKSALKMAKLNYKLSRKRLLRAQLDLEYQVAQSFYGLYSAIEKERIAKQTLEQQSDAYRLARNKFKAGVIAEVEALQMEVDLGQARNNYDLARVDHRSRADALKQLLGIDLQDSIVVNTDLTYRVVHVDEETAIEFGLKNRLELQEQKISIEQQKLNIAQLKAQHTITGKISAYYDFIGVKQDPIDYVLASTFNNAWQELKRRPGNRGVSLTINIPLWDWGVNKNRVLAAESQLKKMQLTLNDARITIIRDIRNTVLELQTSLRRLQLLEKNVEVAEKSFAISKSRFANGDISSQSLALDRNRLSQAYESRLNALISYKLLLVDVKRKTFYDFVRQCPVMLDEYLVE